MKKLEITLLQMYCDRSRHYHGVNHILELLNLFHHNVRAEGLPDAGKLIKLAYDPVNIHWAILAHDCVYDGTKKDNEEQSALVWEDLHKTFIKAGAFGAERISDMILASKRHQRIETDEYPSHTNDINLFLSLDLSPLAVSLDVFQRNSDLIREEYSHVPDDMFLQGRKAFFQKMLERPYIYPHHHLENVWGDKARDNIQKGIDLIS